MLSAARFGIAVAGTVAALAVVPAADAAGQPPVTVNGGLNEQVFGARGAAGPDGTTHIVWDDYYYPSNNNTVHYGSLSDSGAVSSPVLLSGGQNGLNPVIAARPDGGADVAWLWNGGGMGYARVDSDGNASAPVTLTGSSFGSVPAIVVDADGVATVAWTEGGSVLYLRISAAGTVGSVQTAGATSSGRTPGLAVDSSGNVVVAWAEGDGNEIVAKYVRIDSNGNADSPVTAGSVASDAQSVDDLGLAIDDGGTVVITFTGTIFNFMSSTAYGYYVVVPAGSSSGTVREFTDPSVGQSRAIIPALYPDGRALISGIDEPQYGFGAGTLRAIPVSANGTPGSKLTVSSDSSADRPQLNIDRGSTATFTWSDNDAVRASRMDDGDSPTAPEAISAAGTGQLSTSIDSLGNVTAVWAPFGYATVDTARFPAPPHCDPAHASIGASATTLIALTCAGSGSLTYAIDAAPAHGAASIDPVSGVVTYTADAGYAGADTFTFKASNANGTSQSRPATIQVTTAPSPQAAAGDAPGDVIDTKLSSTLLARKGSMRGALTIGVSTTGPADVKLDLVRRFGRSENGRCRPTSARNRTRPRCKLDATAFTTSAPSAAAGWHSVVIPATVVRKLLRPGAYNLIARTKNGTPVSRGFVVRWRGMSR